MDLVKTKQNTAAKRKGVRYLKFAIDLSSETLRIFDYKKIYFEDYFLMKTDKNGNILEIGQQCLKELKTDSTKIEAPLLSDFANHTQTEKLLKYILNQCRVLRLFQKNKAVISVPSHMADFQTAHLENYLLAIGLNKALIYPQIYVAALGSNLDINSRFSSTILHIGANECTIALFKKGRCLRKNTGGIAGKQVDNAIYHWILYEYGYEISSNMVRLVKLELMSFNTSKKDKVLPLIAVNKRTNKTETIYIRQKDANEFFKKIIRTWAKWISKFIEECRLEEQEDIVKRGIVCSGGMFLRTGIDQELNRQLNVYFYRSEEPDKCVELGLLKLLKNL